MNESGKSAEDKPSAKASFLTSLQQGIVRCDGSMGYLLTRQGVSRNQSFDFMNIEDARLIKRVHQKYVDDAQVNLLQTNTFGANRFHLSKFGRAHEHLVEVINRMGVEIARSVADENGAFVGGSIGPLIHSSGDRMSSKLKDPVAIREAYEEQIEALGKAGIDCFMIETVHRQIEGLTALEIAKTRFPDIPVVFQVASTERGQTVALDDVETLIREADAMGADCLGLNCFLDPAQMYGMIHEIRQWTDKPLSAQPNLGKRAQLCQGVFEEERSLQTTVRVFAAKMIAAGVRLIGGCCGMTPEHIALTAKQVAKLPDEAVDKYRTKHVIDFESARKTTVGTFRNRENYVPTQLEADLRSHDLTRAPILVEIDPPRVGESPAKALKGVRLLREAGIKYLTIGDNPGRQPRIDRNTFAQMVLKEAPDVELVLHISCADTTLVRFATELESLHHLSRNILVISGDPPNGEYARSSAPYDFRSVSAIRAFSRRNHGYGLAGEEDLAPTDYFVGGALNPRGMSPQFKKFWTKSANAGASFCMTQPVFDKETLDSMAEHTETFRARLKAERNRDCFFFPGVMALVSKRNAKILRSAFGMPIAKSLIEQFEAAKTRKDQRRLGRQVVRDMCEQIKQSSAFQGLYVVTQFHNYKSTLADLRETGWIE